MKIVFDLAKTRVVAEILEETEVHVWIIAALMEELQDMKEVASVKSCETERCTRQGSPAAPTQWKSLTKYIPRKVDDTWRARVRDCGA